MEDKKCDAMISSLTAKEVDEVYEQGILLRDDQLKRSDISLLPSVKLEGIQDDVNIGCWCILILDNGVC